MLSNVGSISFVLSIVLMLTDYGDSKAVSYTHLDVYKRQVLMLEAMKMQNEIASPVDGTVKSINVDVNENVKPGQTMAVIG